MVFCIGAAVDIADGLKPIKWDLQDDKMRQEVVWVEEEVEGATGSRGDVEMRY